MPESLFTTINNYTESSHYCNILITNIQYIVLFMDVQLVNEGTTVFKQMSCNQILLQNKLHLYPHAKVFFLFQALGDIQFLYYSCSIGRW